MTTVIHRPRKGMKPAFALNDGQRKRVDEHLKSVGIDVDRLPKCIWPDDAVSAWQEHPYAPWQFRYKGDIRREKMDRMNQRLWYKREYGRTEIRALYVWVFWCPGISGIFEGLWTYIVGNSRRYHGGGYKGEVTGKLLGIVMDMFPVANPHPLFPLEHRDWMPLFIKKYGRGKWCGKPQGKAPILAEVQHGRIKWIIGPAEWPNEGSK